MTPRRAVWAALACAMLAFVAYGSLVPFTWSPEVGWSDAVVRWRAMASEPVTHVWRGDFPVNVLLFLPAGFCLAAAIAPRSRGAALAAVVPAALLCSLAAMTVEFAQLFIRDRTASWSDVVALSLGATGGAVLWSVVGLRAVDRAVAAFASAAPDRLEWALLWAYAALWTGVALLPLAFPRFAYPLVRTVWLRAAYQPALLERVADWMLTGLAVMPLGVLAGVSTVRWSTTGRGAAVALAALIVLALDAVRQVTPLSTAPEPLSRLCGVGIGAWVGWRAGGRALLEQIVPRRRWFVALAVLVIVAVAWAPFDFGVARHELAERFELLYQRVPLYRHYWAPPLAALNAVLTVFMMAAALAALLRIREDGAASAWSTVLLATAVFVLIEWGQIHLPGRRPDPADVIIAACGAITGAWLAGVVAASRSRPRAGS